MEIKLNLSREDLAEIEEFRLLFKNDAKKRGDQYQVDLCENSSIEKITGHYLSSKLQNW